jgi:hypothetical protein
MAAAVYITGFGSISLDLASAGMTEKIGLLALTLETASIQHYESINIIKLKLHNIYIIS